MFPRFSTSCSDELQPCAEMEKHPQGGGVACEQTLQTLTYLPEWSRGRAERCQTTGCGTRVSAGTGQHNHRSRQWLTIPVRRTLGVVSVHPCTNTAVRYRGGLGCSSGFFMLEVNRIKVQELKLCFRSYKLPVSEITQANNIKRNET